MTKINESKPRELELEQVSFIEGDVIFPLPPSITRPRLAALADDATAAAERASASIDDVLDFVAASEARINEMENSRRERT